MADQETTPQRAARLRREGVVLCGEPTAADLDAVEEFRGWLRALPAGRAPDPTKENDRA